TAEGTAGSICDFKTLILDGCKITSPAGAVWNAGKRAVCDASGNIITDKVTIAPVTTYALKIAGTQVTSDNCNDLSVIDGVSGRVKYNPATHTLTLYNATINGGNYIGIVSDIDDLTVKLIGSNTVTSMLDGVRHTKWMTITGGGTLNAESTNACGIFTDKTSLTIKGCAVNAKGISGITGYDGSSESLSIGNATTVTAEGWDGSILNFKTLTLDGCKITSPAGAVWNAGKHAVCDASGNIIITKVTIEPLTSYGLYIAGKQVTSGNCNDLSVIPGVSGTVKYDHSTKTLTLDNAAINAGGEKHGIYSKINDLTVKLIGTNTVTGFDAIGHSKSMTIKGSGTLNAEGSDGPPGIFTDETSLTIDGCTVNVKGGWGILGGNKGSTLTIRNATVTAEGTAGSICDFKTLILDGCKITSPAGAVWNADAEKRAVCDAWGHIIKSKVTIEPATTYRLYIAGTQVNSANCNDLSVISGVSGTVKYDHSTKTLTLDNATINAGNKISINSEIDNLTVKLTGTNTVTSVRHTKPMFIAGGGTLNAESTNDCGIYVFKTSLTIDGCTVNAKGEYGIAGYNGSSESLTIRNATVTAEGSKGSILDFKEFTLDGCKITSPAGAVWNAEKRAVCDASGNIITDKVTITRDTNGIETVTADVPAGKRGVYNLQGV
ncbi:hypothetical protein, partial [Prevotella sp. OH937_COT-195]|uniref:hypothetical protein n=1 Tax=Prevotella sp. OH937_COT-195 TaxID=2491051 RepID=UPI001315904D